MSDLTTANDLSGRTAVIAGAGSDIGAAIAVRLAAAGANVVLGDVDVERMQPTAERLAADGAGVLALRTDVTLHADAEALIQRAVADFGRIDVMANIAGVIHDSLVIETREADLDRVLAVNLKGTFFACQAAAAAMAAQGAGSIINMSSTAAFSPMPKLACYAMSKAGVVALTKVLAHEVGPLGVRVNAIAPGFVEGGMTTRRARRPDGSIDEELLEADRARSRKRNPLRTTGLPEDIAEVTLFLASDASRYLTGQVLHPNGGSYMP